MFGMFLSRGPWALGPGEAAQRAAHSLPNALWRCFLTGVLAEQRKSQNWFWEEWKRSEKELAGEGVLVGRASPIGSRGSGLKSVL